ncbi:MAG: FAD-binding oxidoreductase, partial [Planctomycetes bacterium]|nr:FAD-binding oxidoreductase [Planctomycetota bacterium]
IRGWSSMYTISDDWHPLVGQEPEVPGYYACVAGCGHGFKLAPPMGEALADIIAGETPNIDIHPLRPDRFIEGEYFQSVWGSGNRG